MRLLRNFYITQSLFALHILLMIYLITVGTAPQLFAGGAKQTYESAPNWWKERKLIDLEKDEKNLGIVNLGQVKWLATQAQAELKAHFAFEGAPNFTLPAALTQAPASPEERFRNSHPANLGQLKNAALPFYKILNEISPAWVKQSLESVGLVLGSSFWEVTTPDANYAAGFYPWNPATPVADNKQAAVVGQAKVLFSPDFRKDAEAPADGLSDLFELALLKYHPAFQAGGVYAHVKDIGKIGLTEGQGFLAINATLAPNVTAPRISAPQSDLADANSQVTRLLESHQPVASMKGGFSVSQDGSASYTIPIDLPKGAGGIEPDISINYSSNGGLGLLGLGFSLSYGADEITRGAPTELHDGYNGAISYTSRDRFYLSGQRLVCVSGNYGEENSEYRTEKEVFARIILRGGNGESANSYWEVQSASGLTSLLGNTSDSRVLAKNPAAPLAWSTSRVTDTVGNFYTYTYLAEAPVAGELHNRRIGEIRYTGNAGVAPQTHVTFVYEDRTSDKRFAYHPSGLLSNTNKRLKNIEVKTERALNHKYHLEYETSHQTSRSLLKKISKEMGNGAKVPPTVFEWQGLKAGEAKWVQAAVGTFAAIPKFTETSGGSRGVQIIDLNADGLPDMIDQKVTDLIWSGTELVPNPTAVSGTVYENTGSNFITNNSLLPNSRHVLAGASIDGDWFTRFDLNSVPCDINGDGQLDLFVTELVSGGAATGITATQRYKFMTLSGGSWLEMADYHPKFESRGTHATSNGYPGIKHLLAKDLVDMNVDGYLDLVLETHSHATLASTVNSATLLPQLSRTVFLNLVHKGQGWVQASHLAPPLPLRKSTDSINLSDNGNRLLDYDGDGFLDMLSGDYREAVENYPGARKFFPAVSLNGVAGWLDSSRAITSQDRSSAWLPGSPVLPYPPQSSYPDIPSMVYRDIVYNFVGGGDYSDSYRLLASCDAQAPLLDTSGTRMLDLNGDGLIDVSRAYSRFWTIFGRLIRYGTRWHTFNAEVSHSSWFNTGRELADVSASRWLKDGSPYGQGYTLPISLTQKGNPEGVANYRNQNTSQFTDLNGDGLVDVLFSREGNEYVGPRGYGTNLSTDPFGGSNNGGFINNGTGWVQDASWGLPTGIRLGKSGTEAPAAIVADINADGFPDIIGKILNGQQPEPWLNQCKPEVITKITDAFSKDIQVDYRRLNDPSTMEAFGEGSRVYAKDFKPMPTGVSSVIDNSLVVARYSEPNGLASGRNYTSQRYGDLRYDVIRKSSMGFGWVEAIDETSGQCTRTDFSRDYPFYGMPILTQAFAKITAEDLTDGKFFGAPVTPGDVLMSRETATYFSKQLCDEDKAKGGGTFHIVTTSSTKEQWNVCGCKVTGMETEQRPENIDKYGFSIFSITKASDGTQTQTRSAYDHITSSGKWHLGRLSSSTVEKFAEGSSTTRNATFTYFLGNGLLESETVQPGHARQVKKSYIYDKFGNVVETHVTAAADDAGGSVQTRSSSSEYDPTGRYVIKETNALNHSTSYVYDTPRSLLRSMTDPNDLTIRYFYDEFGTQILTRGPDGSLTAEITSVASNAQLPPNVVDQLTQAVAYSRSSQSSGAPIGIVYFDAQGRELVKETLTLRNHTASGAARYAKVYAVSKYDARGRKVQSSAPFDASETPLYTTVTFDALNRVVRTSYPDGTADFLVSVTFANHGTNNPLTKTVATNRNGQSAETWQDQHGRTVKTIDESKLENIFTYDVSGGLKTVTLGGVLLQTNVFDPLFGTRSSTTEANSGTSSTTYNGFGETVSITNARDQKSTSTYDVAGRVLSTTSPEGSFQYVYDTAPGAAKGKIHKVTGTGGYEELSTYDSLGRTLTSSITQFGETHSTSTQYDALGRVFRSTDAGGVTVENRYDPLYNYPVETILISTPELIGAGLTLWKAGTYNSKGQVLTQTLGQGVTTQTNYFPITDEVNSHQATHPSAGLVQHKSYTWQPNGNLETRSDHLVKRQQTFGYDKLNRIDTVSTAALSGSTISTLPPPEKYEYAPNGNLLAKKADGTAYASLQYDSSRPHAVTSALIRGEQRTYDYDADGNVISDGKRTFTYSSGTQLKTLSYTSAPSLKSLNFENPSEFHPLDQRIECRFEFNASQSRSFQLKQRISSPADGSVVMHEERTRYLGSYEREIHHRRSSPAANLELEKTLHRHTLPGGTIYTRSISPSGNLTSAKLTSVLSDHLGSTDVLLVSAWNGNGWSSPLIERQAFNSWGERANAQTWENARNSSADPYRTSAHDYDRGYTGHEQLDDSGLIHMNGRIYDPELGRMLGADPIVQLPEFSQNLNRYSYVLNNPLNATDPSGYSWLSKAFKKIGNWLKENWRTVVSIVFTFVLFFVLGPAGGWLMGALKGFLSGAFNAAIHGGGVKDILRGAVVGAIQGGLSAGLLHGMEPSSFGLKEAFKIESMKHIAGHGIVGGLASEAMGGKFQDGFVAAASAAFASNAGLLGPAPTENDGFIQVAQRTAAAAVVGGTAAALGGGKFGNGAWTAAFQHLLNSERDYIGKMFEPLTAMTKPLQNWLNPPVYDVQMELIYDKNPTSKLTVKTANGNREFMVFSGTGNYRNDPAYEGVQNIGPAPRGKYYITDRPSGRIPNPFKMRWFALYRDDGKVNDVTYVGNIKRSTIRMHPGSVSKGCITFSGNDFSEVRGILIDSGTRNIPGTNIPYYGILNIK